MPRSLPGGVFTTDLLRLYADRAGDPGRDPDLDVPRVHAQLRDQGARCSRSTPGCPDAHVQAPTAGSVILAGVLLKMGTYGLVRFCLPLFPVATFTFMPYIAVLAVIGIIYGALVSMVQPDLKKLVAYSSVSHLGFVVLGIFALNEEGMQGSVIQMINHGLSTGALFLLVGMIYDRRHTRHDQGLRRAGQDRCRCSPPSS